MGDLTINCHVDVKEHEPDGEVVLDLNQGARSYRCHLELATGRATLAYAEPHDATDMGEEHKLASTTTPFVGPGSHDISFANVDDRLCLWIDGRLVQFTESTDVHALRRRPDSAPWDEDLIPVGIAARGADVTVSHLFLQRDIYYRNDFARSGSRFADNQPGRDDDGIFQDVQEYVGQFSILQSKVDNPSGMVPRIRARTRVADDGSRPGIRERFIPIQNGQGRVLHDGGQQPAQQRQPAVVQRASGRSPLRGTATGPGRKGVLHLLAARHSLHE